MYRITLLHLDKKYYTDTMSLFQLSGQWHPVVNFPS